MSGESISAAGIEAGHTPGPWHVLNNGYCVGGPPSVQLADPIGAGVAMCCMAARSPDETAANARLIAAAPELLEACRAMVAWDEAEKAGPDYGGLTRDTHPSGEAIWREWWDGQLKLCDKAFVKAKSAIARAEGRA